MSRLINTWPYFSLEILDMAEPFPTTEFNLALSKFKVFTEDSFIVAHME